MVVVDANVLVYAVNADAPHHATAQPWLDVALTGGEGVGLPWTVLLAYLRLVTDARIMPAPQPVADACEQVERWLAAPAAIALEPSARHSAVLAGLLRESGTAGNLVNDAHLAALAVEHDATVVSYDRDFARFRGVRHRVPGA